MVSTENTETLRNWVRRGCIMWAVCMPRKWDCTRKTFWIPAEILGSETRFDISNIYISFLKENVKYKIKVHLKLREHMFDLKS